jgi:TPR repeat protein
MADFAPRYPSYDPDVEPYEEAPTGPGHPLAPYQAGRAARENYREQSVPLFLSDSDGKPDPSEYMPPSPKRRASYTSRIFVSALACAAAGILAALFSSDAAREFIASAKASSTAALSVASAAMYPSSTQPNSMQPKAREVPLKDSARLSAPGKETPGVRSVAVAAVTPSPEEIKTAYQSALQGSAPQIAVVPAPERAVSANAIHHLDPNEIASLLKRADTLIASGDIAAARLVLQRAAEAADGRAAMMLAGTYDPTVLEKLGVHGVVPDLAVARSWYEKARQLGASEATAQLEGLASRQH